jgi:ATP-dependent 26S proteasome regulatory subunit
MDQFKLTLSRLLKARFPFIYIPTAEENRLMRILMDLAADAQSIKTPRMVFTWTATQGFVSDRNPAPAKGTADPLKALEMVETATEAALFVFKDMHVYLGGRHADFKVIRKLRDLHPKLKFNEKPQNVIFISPSLELPPELDKIMTILDFELPTFEEISLVLDDMIQANQAAGRITIDLPEDGREKLVKAAMGLTLQEAENAFARAMIDDGRLDIRDVDVIHEEKCQIIKKSGILEYVQTAQSMMDVGGLMNLKRWLEKRDKSWQERARRYGLPAPKGILITGVPGCGKSLCAKASSAMWQLPLLRLDVGRIFSGLVGSSEENMRKALQTAEAISPSILWIDEIEKGFGGAGGERDGGTSSRVFGTFLTWLQEKQKAVFVIATSNNIDILPPELLRKGRFDEIFFVDLPTRTERVAIFAVHLRKRLIDKQVIGDFNLTGDALKRLADLTEGFSGAEIEQAVIAGLFEAFSENRSITLPDFEHAITNTVPLSVTMVEKIMGIREWANMRAVAATPREERAEYDQLPAEPDAGEQKSQAQIERTRGGRAIDF